MLVLAIVALLVPLGLSLRDRVDAEVRLQARSEAEVVAARATSLIAPPRLAQLDALAARAARAVRGRVLIVGRDGRLLADSAGAARGSSYASRPEIASALGGTVAQERRTSKTLNEEILATAVPVFARNRVGGAVRVTQSIAAVHNAVRRTWIGLGIIGGIVLALGLVAGSIIARRVSRPILALDRAARRVAEGDLTARARVEGSAEQQDLARTFNGMTERISLLLAAQREFVADASHQLRTPLAGLRLRLEEARAEPTTPTQREDLDAGLSEVDRLAEIVTELLELSRAGEGDRPAATTEVGAAVARLAERWTAPALDAGCTLEVHMAAVAAAPVACHPADVDRILDALVENAIAYAPGTSILVEATADTIAVRDGGPGLAADEEQTVFERFHRGSAGRGGPAGTGLGLPIARELARRWGGDVTLTNAPGGGALATVTLRAAGA
ncbi:MAG TPA: HAMP domain-containing sensor histidine kinase [Solirubrobacteraceae bacterium]